MDERPDKLARIFIELEVMAQWATCQRGRVGSALVTPKMVIVVPARNGTPYGMPSCRELGLDPFMRCNRCVHSEKNAINHAARLGVCTRGLALVTLKRPCVSCANDIVQAGILAVYYREDYDTDTNEGGLSYVRELFEKSMILFRQIEMTSQEKSFHEMITQWRSSWTSS